jgi:hypothetical protein
MKKWLYAFKCPLGGNAVKIGITSNPRSRLGSYQCAYSREMHQACFDYVWEGTDKHIDALETALKNKYDWDIASDTLGESEWVSGILLEDIIVAVDEQIKGWHFHISVLPTVFPITQDNVGYKIGNEPWRGLSESNVNNSFQE